MSETTLHELAKGFGALLIRSKVRIDLVRQLCPYSVETIVVEGTVEFLWMLTNKNCTIYRLQAFQKRQVD